MVRQALFPFDPIVDKSFHGFHNFMKVLFMGCYGFDFDILLAKNQLFLFHNIAQN